MRLLSPNSGDELMATRIQTWSWLLNLSDLITAFTFGSCLYYANAGPFQGWMNNEL